MRRTAKSAASRPKPAQASAGMPTIASAWVKGIVRLFESVGLNVSELFRDAGVDLDAVAQHDARFDPDRISTLWELAVARSGNPYLGLAMPDVAHPGSMDVIVHLMMTCPDLLTAIERFLRYLRIVSDAAEIELVREEGGHGLTVRLIGGTRPVPRARVDFVVVTLLNIFRWLTGLNLRPVAVDFPYPEPPDLQPYRLACRSPLRFDAPIHCIHFAQADLLAPLPTANPALALASDRVAREYLSRLETGVIAPRVKEVVVRRLADGDPLRADIARELRLSERTLQRRLQDEGTSFHELVDATRREMAEQYLQSGRVALTETAYLLGFADQSTFFRACRRWFGTSPGEYRSRFNASR